MAAKKPVTKKKPMPYGAKPKAGMCPGCGKPMGMCSCKKGK